jgi:hypothetical protein
VSSVTSTKGADVECIIEYDRGAYVSIYKGTGGIGTGPGEIACDSRISRNQPDIMHPPDDEIPGSGGSTRRTRLYWDRHVQGTSESLNIHTYIKERRSSHLKCPCVEWR